MFYLLPFPFLPLSSVSIVPVVSAVIVPVESTAATAATSAALFDLNFIDWVGCRSASHRSVRVENLAAVNPAFDADDSESGQGFGETEINVGAQGVKRKTSFQR